jgi:hypothetical protein
MDVDNLHKRISRQFDSFTYVLVGEVDKFSR